MEGLVVRVWVIGRGEFMQLVGVELVVEMMLVEIISDRVLRIYRRSAGASGNVGVGGRGW